MSSNRVTIHGDFLKGTDIAYLVTASVAAEKSPEIARRLKYYGANVHPYITDAAEGFTGVKTLEFAAKTSIIKELTYDVEHLKKYDAVLIAPGTGNTINKFANGDSDTPPLSMLQGALGRLEKSKADESEVEKPILIAPAMHDDLYNSILQENISELKEKGVIFIDPVYRDGRKNMADPYTIVANVCRATSKDKIKGKEIIVATGPTIEPLDSLRYMTNIFRGRLGLYIAQDAWFRGADVKLIYGDGGRLEIPEFMSPIRVKTFDETYKKILEEFSEFKPDAGILVMSATDYKLAGEPFDGKMSSHDTAAMNMLAFDVAPKIIEKVRNADLDVYLVTAKLENRKEDGELIEIGKNRAEKGNFELVIANDLQRMTKEDHPAFIVNKNEVLANPKTNKEISNKILEILGKELN
ncbi:MAG: bifunctional phosphopantothenoylcysteine decarboxylase/phosphopantothenate--cysteine ligase CoaBC [archaeon]|nr:bifunctional phosphopantothenoylcysteine decarboxylase/phosphopantothenate--cysteine ligase CoaBC [archaeon]